MTLHRSLGLRMDPSNRYVDFNSPPGLYSELPLASLLPNGYPATTTDFGVLLSDTVRWYTLALPGTYTYATLPSAAALPVIVGTTAYTSDRYEVRSNGTDWITSNLIKPVTWSTFNPKVPDKKPSFLISGLVPKAIYTDGLQATDAVGNVLYGEYPDRILANSALQFYFRFAEISGPSSATPNLTDIKGGNVFTVNSAASSGYQQPGMLPGGGLGLVNPSTVVGGSFNTSMFFNGMFFVAASAIWAPTAASPWTVMAIVRPNVTRSGGATDYTLWSNRDSATLYGGIGIGLRWTTTKTILQCTMASNSNGAHYNQLQSTTDLLNATVYFISVSFNGNAASANGGIAIQINGLIEANLTSNTLASDVITSAVAVNLGRQNAASPAVYKGNLGELAIFNAALSTTEIAYLHRIGMGIAPLTPLTYPVNVIYDNDCADDSGNVQGYTLLHVAANNGVANIQAMTVVDTYTYSAAVVQALNNYYGRGTIPLGANQSSSITSNHFTAQTIAANFGTTAYTLSAFGAAGNTPIPVLRRALAANVAAGTKAMIIASGFLTNIAALLASPADSISPLTGAQLITAGCSSLLLCAGRWPSNVLNAITAPEFNLATDITASQAVLNGSNWPTPIVICGCEMGDNAGAGPLTSASTYYNATTNINQAIWAAATDLTNGFRAVWDALPMLYLMGGVGTVFDYGGLNGTIAIDGSGNNVWSATPGNASYLRMKLTNAQLASLVTSLFSAA